MQNELSQEAIYSLYYEAIAFTDTVLQIWLTVTFGAIIALYIASVSITRLLRFLITGLYTASSVVLIGRWIIAATHMDHYQRLLEAQNMTPFPTPPGLVSWIGPSVFGLMVIGSLVTIFFLATFKREPESLS